jgi:tetratricopeptide (TPR) repeat protein
MNLGVVLLDLGSLQEAERHLGRALTIHCELSNRRFEAATLCSLAEVWHQQDRRELALDGYEQALTLLREVGERRFAGHAQAALARLRFECGQVLEARELLGEALEIQRKLGERRFEAFALMGLARLRRLGEGRLQDAQELLDQAESNLRGIGSELALALTLAERVHLALALGRPRPEALQEAEALAGKQELEPDSLVVRDISRARKAHEASASGRLLFRGECVEDLPEGLRRWLIETSQLEAGAVPGPAASAGPRLWHGTRPAGS